MSDNLFSPLPKKKLLAYGTAYVAVLLLFAALMVFLGDPLSGVLRGVGLIALVSSALLAGGMWLIGGAKTEVKMGSSSTTVPTRLRDAMPLIIGLVVLSQVLRLLALWSAK